MARRRPGRKRQKPVTLGNVIMLEVENPLYSRAHDGDRTNPRTITACYNPRESYAGMLYARKTITQAENEAATRIRRAWEGIGGAGAKAMDYSKLVVDGGLTPEPLSERQQEYGRLLKDAALRLGPQGYDLTIKLAGQGLMPKDMVATRRQQDYLGQRFQECLETLAVHWGLQKSRIRSWRENA
jgi:hypothetical protein